MPKDKWLKFNWCCQIVFSGLVFASFLGAAVAAQSERMPLLMPDDFSDLHLVAWRVEPGTPDPDNPPLVRWESPRLCRGGSKSLTDPAVFGWEIRNDADSRPRLPPALSARASDGIWSNIPNLEARRMLRKLGNRAATS